MLRPCLLAALVLAAWSLPAELPHPSDLALVLGPEEFEDYLDQWLEVEQERRAANWTVVHDAEARSGCSLHVNQDFGQPQPVYIRNGRYLAPSGNNGRVRLNSGETVLVACVGSGRSIRHPNLSKTGLASATARCEGGTSISGSGWLSGRGEFGGLTCSGDSFHAALATNDRCYGNNLVIRVGYNVNNKFHPLYYSCFDQARLEVLYVWYEQGPGHAVSQVGVGRPNWMAGSFYPGVDINNYYRQATQKKEIAKLIGEDLTNKYITNIHFLNRGHLTAKSDFPLATGQRTTFYFINAAPQWQAFNSGNWNTLEQELRFRIGAAGYNTMVYTGTYGISYLRDGNNRPVDLYLYRDKNNNNKLPVPLYYYKVVVDESRQIGTAFIGINNPYVTDSEARSLAFCKDRCRNNSAFSWLKWRPDRVDLGYSFCCTLADFRKVVKHLPNFKANGLLA